MSIARGNKTTNTTAATSGATSISLTVPDHSAGDYLVAIVGILNGNDLIVTNSGAPAGWTLLRSAGAAGAGNTTAGRLYFYGRIGAGRSGGSGAEPASYSWGIGGAARVLAGEMIAYSGVKTTITPYASASNATTTSSTAPASLAVTTGAYQHGSVVWAATGRNMATDTSGNMTVPSGFTSVDILETTNASNILLLGVGELFDINSSTAGPYTGSITTGTGSGTVLWSCVAIVLIPASENLPPVVNAGTDFTASLNAVTFTLTGTATDAPDGTIASTTWSQVSGPSSTITSPSSLTTSVTPSVAGTYTFRLSATDNSGATITDDVIVTVVGNIAPVVNAGPDADAIAGVNFTLTGTATDSDGTVSSTTWSQVSGPSSTITSPSALTTTVSTSTHGERTYRLSATDNSGATSTDDVLITVIPAGVAQGMNSGYGTTMSINLATALAGATPAAGDTLILTAMHQARQQCNTPSGLTPIYLGVDFTLPNNTAAYVASFKRTLTSGDIAAMPTYTFAAFPGPISQAWAVHAVTVGSLAAGREVPLAVQNNQIKIPTITFSTVTNPGGATAATPLKYRVTAVDAAGEGPPFTDYTPATSPAVLNSTHYVALTWVPIVRAQSYKVYRSTDGGATWVLVGSTSTANTTGDVTNYTPGLTDTGQSTAGSIPTNYPAAAVMDGTPVLSTRDPIPFAGAKMLVYYALNIPNPDALPLDGSNPKTGTQKLVTPTGLSKLRQITYADNAGPGTVPNAQTITGTGGANGQRTFIFGAYWADSLSAGPIGSYAATVSPNPEPVMSYTAQALILRPSSANSTPAADAGLDMSVNVGDPVHLNGARSADPDGDTLTYAWTQTAGTTVTLTGATTSTPTFTAPSSPGTLTFQLTVTDQSSVTATDTVVVTVRRHYAQLVRAGGSWVEHNMRTRIGGTF